MKYRTHLLNIFIAIFLLFLVIAKFEFKFSIKIYLFLRSTRLMILTFDFPLPLQYSQSTIYYLLALIPVKFRLFQPRISTRVCKSILFMVSSNHFRNYESWIFSQNLLFVLIWSMCSNFILSLALGFVSKKPKTRT